MSDTPQKIVDDIDSARHSWMATDGGRAWYDETIEQAPARIQALIDQAREEGQEKGLAIAHATEQRLSKVREKGG